MGHKRKNKASPRKSSGKKRPEVAAPPTTAPLDTNDQVSPKQTQAWFNRPGSNKSLLPHLMQYCRYTELLLLRATTKEIRKAVDETMCHHIVLHTSAYPDESWLDITSGDWAESGVTPGRRLAPHKPQHVKLLKMPRVRVSFVDHDGVLSPIPILNAWVKSMTRSTDKSMCGNASEIAEMLGHGLDQYPEVTALLANAKILDVLGHVPLAALVQVARAACNLRSVRYYPGQNGLSQCTISVPHAVYVTMLRPPGPPPGVNVDPEHLCHLSHRPADRLIPVAEGVEKVTLHVMFYPTNPYFATATSALPDLPRSVKMVCVKFSPLTAMFDGQIYFKWNRRYGVLTDLVMLMASAIHRCRFTFVDLHLVPRGLWCPQFHGEPFTIELASRWFLSAVSEAIKERCELQSQSLQHKPMEGSTARDKSDDILPTADQCRMNGNPDKASTTTPSEEAIREVVPHYTSNGHTTQEESMYLTLVGLQPENKAENADVNPNHQDQPNQGDKRPSITILQLRPTTVLDPYEYMFRHFDPFLWVRPERRTATILANITLAALPDYKAITNQWEYTVETEDMF